MTITNSPRVHITDTLTTQEQAYTWTADGRVYSSLDHANDVAAELQETFPPITILNLVTDPPVVSAYDFNEYCSDYDHAVNADSVTVGGFFRVMALENDITVSFEFPVRIEDKAEVVVRKNEIATFLRDDTNRFVRVADSSKKNNNVETFGGSIPASVSTILYEDGFVTFSWNSAFKQMTFALKDGTPLGDWGRPCFSHCKLDGNTSTTTTSNAAIRRMTGRQLASTSTTKYWSRTGNRVTAYDMENYGSSVVLNLTNETYVEDFPSYKIDLHLGRNDHVNYIITTINRPRG